MIGALPLIRTQGSHALCFGARFDLRIHKDDADGFVNAVSVYLFAHSVCTHKVLTETMGRVPLEYMLRV